MAKLIHNRYQKTKNKISPLLLSLLIVLSAAIPFIDSGLAHATTYDQIADRSITMSTSQASATGVTYTVSFTAEPSSSYDVEGIVVDFCNEQASPESDGPIIDGDCVAPTGFSVSATPGVSGITGLGSSGTWAPSTLTGDTTFVLTNTSASNSLSSGDTVSFEITTVTNPTATNTSFYARILTYNTTAGATSYTATGVGSDVPEEAGGIALSTANQINITAKVQEELTFCVYTGADCAAGGSTVTLGNNLGVLSASSSYVDTNTKYDIQTNAQHAAAISVQGDTLTSGSNTITAMGSSPTSSTSGTSQFGMCTWEEAGANLTPASPYNDSNCDTTGTGFNGVYSGAAKFGFSPSDIVANATAGPSSTGEIAFLANISNTTTAGIYTTTLTFVATAEY